MVNHGLTLALLTGGSFLGSNDEDDTPLGRFHAAINLQDGKLNQIAGAAERNAELMQHAVEGNQKVTAALEGLQVLGIHCHHDGPGTQLVVGDPLCEIKSLDLVGFEPSVGRLHAEL
jgi:hypothetical protein